MERYERTAMPGSLHHNDGTRFKLLGVIKITFSYIIGLPWFLLLVGALKNNPTILIATFIILGALLSHLYHSGIKNYLQGKKLVAATRPSPTAQDTRGPVVYLRPFKDDISTAQPFGDGLPGSEFSYISFTTEEEQLAAVMTELGPFRALGRPGEEVPELGADRTYAQGETWQEEVTKLISAAQLVVIRLGMTEWVIWEVSTAIDILDADRLLLLVPWELDYHTFHSKLAKLFPGGLPERIGSRWFPGNDRIRGVIYFDREWKPHFAGLKLSRRYSGTRPLNASLKIALSPLIGRLGLRFEPLRVPWAVKAPIVLFLLFMLLAVLLHEL